MNEYRRTSGSYVVRLSDGASIPPDNDTPESLEYQAWLAAGNSPDPAQTYEEAREELAAQFEQAIQSHLNSAAQSLGYDSIATAVSYAEEPAVQRFQNDGKAFRAWRSLVWAYAYQELAKVKAGEREIPALDAFLAELPALPAAAA
ncbi:hypothetical protein [uncultured Pseudomonas sp.]|uniref:hypothetical protein n=1 Tax=uncultured Pseudomonas sp. TaxID=114707 RepID=UPI0025866AE9|nr:hypothetical protein [uncultured Pseudomonas sp.]